MTWFLALGAALFASFNIHSHTKALDYRSEIWADKAGYYVYLPATFIYSFNTALFPDSIEFKTGEGFTFDRTHNKINTKYPCGVAILEAPFFIATHLYCKLSGKEASGFTIPYHRAIDMAGVFYLMLGFYFLFRSLKNYFPEKIILLSFFLYFAGTNLYFYSILETGLSHVYSFFLFSLFLFLYKKYLINPQWKLLCTLAICTGMILLVRQINLVFLPVFFLLDSSSWKDPITRLQQNWKSWLAFAGIVLIVLIPQIVYYVYQSGNVLSYSYQDESFIYKFSPRLFKVWFAFENGWLTNNPMHLFTILGIIAMIRQKLFNGWLALLLILAVSYVYGSWWSYKLGCGFGHRGFVEFYSFLLIPFTFWIQHVVQLENKKIRFLNYFFLLLFVVYNIKLIYTYDGCWYGNGPWDYSQFEHLLFSATK